MESSWKVEGATCYAPDAPPGNQNWITYGTTVSLSGLYAFISIRQQEGWEYFIHWVNSRGGVQLNGTTYYYRVLYYDDASVQANDVTFIKILVLFDKVDLIIVPTGAIVNAVTQELATLGVVGIAGTTYLGLANPIPYNSSYVFTLASTIQNVVSSCFSVLQNHGVKTAVVAPSFSATSYILPFVYLLPSYGINVTFVDIYCTSTEPDFYTSKVKEWLSYKPDLLIAGGPDDIALLTQSLRLINQSIFFLSSSAIFQPITWGLENAFLVTPWVDTLSYSDSYFGTGKQFCANFSSYINDSLCNWAAGGTVAGLLASHIAINATQSLNSDVLHAYISQMNEPSFYGPLRFTNGIITDPPICTQVLNQTVEVVYPVNLQTKPVNFVTPVKVPQYLLNRYSSTSFLLSVILGTVLPTIVILALIVVLVIFLIKKYDVIVLPKQEQDWTT